MPGVYLTACPKSQTVLADSLELLARFWPVPVIVDVAGSDESKSSQLLRLLHGIDDPYLILLEDDFLLIRPVDCNLVASIADFCLERQADRFSLQSKNAHHFPHWSRTGWEVTGLPVYRSTPQVTNFVSLEASIWRRQFLLDHLEAGWADDEIENRISDKLRETEHRVYALETLVVEYRDGLRRGRRSVRLLRQPLRLEVDAGEALALYPLGGNQDTTLYLE